MSNKSNNDIHPVLRAITDRLEQARRGLERAQEVYDAEHRDWRACPGTYHANRMQVAMRRLTAARDAWQDTEGEAVADWESEVRDSLR